MRLREKFVSKLHKGEEFIFAHPKWVLGMIFGITLVFASQIPGVRMASDFRDLLPQSHEYIQLHNNVRDIFGGANVITVALEVEEGTVFKEEVLEKLFYVTKEVDKLPGVNHNRVSSLTHVTTRHTRVNEFGNVKSDPYYDPNKDRYTEAELARLKNTVLTDPSVLGRLVSPDLKTAMIKAHMTTSESDVLRQAFAGLQEIRAAQETDNVKIHAVGNPVLTGWVYTYLNQLFEILLYTVALVVALLVLYFRRLYGIALPLVGISLSTAWGLGFMNMVGISLDPLWLPVPFLIAARATSHGVQLVERYYYELSRTKDGAQSARNALDALFRPGSLAIIVDAIGIAAVALGAAPFNKQLGAFAGFWAFSVIFTVHFMCPLALSVLPQPGKTENSRDATSERLFRIMRPGANRKFAGATLTAGLVAIILGGYYATDVKFGESEPGSPILYQDHDYNQSASAITSSFPGSQELFVVAQSEEEQGLRTPAAMKAMSEFQRYMLAEPVIAASKGVPDLVARVNRLLHEGDPRWGHIPSTQRDIGGVLAAYDFSSPIPRVLQEYINHDQTLANLVFYMSDKQVDTLNAAVSRAEEGAEIFGADIDGFSIAPAAGPIGVMYAINEANYHDALLVTTFVLIASFTMVALYYNSLHAGVLMLVPMVFATALSYGFLGFTNTGLNVNLIPVLAVGMGVGIDYAIYVMDRVRDEINKGWVFNEAVAHAFSTTGLAVLFTAATLIAGVIMWLWSDLRFQASAATLLIVMLVLNAVGAMVLVPSWILTFRPKFITGDIDAVETSSLKSAGEGVAEPGTDADGATSGSAEGANGRGLVPEASN